MECPRCQNKDPTYFYLGSNGYYCRKCIGFKRILIEDELDPYEYEVSDDRFNYSFNYSLTDKQIIASNSIKRIIKTKDALLHCVCGAGKTEMVVETISDFIKNSKKVCYAIARREVVIELQKRFSNIFKEASVIGVYGNHHDILSGDLIITTCHQLYRYPKTFDLLIIDEVDAFPLKGNDTLMNITLNSAKSRIIFSTATINNQLMDVLSKRDYETVKVYTRPSNKPLSVPEVFYSPKIISYLLLYMIMRKMTNQCIIFVTSKKECIFLYKLFSKRFKCDYVYSDKKDRNETITKFRNNEYQFLFSTTVLERGLTFYKIECIILQTNRYFDEGNLVQMLGRVGRSMEKEDTRSFIISNTYDKQIINTIKYLKEANSHL